MTQPHVEKLIVRGDRLRWQAFLPKRKAWLQTLILLPFGLPVSNFLAASWLFSVNSLVEDRQYLLGIVSMVLNPLLPSLFFAFMFHWGWFAWRSTSSRWYPQSQALGAGCYATLTIAGSFATVGLFTNSLGVCGNPAWGEIAQNLLCNLDGYGFESKSWFGAWFIVAAYCYQAQAAIVARGRSLKQRMFHRDYSQRVEREDCTSVTTGYGDLSPHEDRSSTPVEQIAAKVRD